MITESSIYWMTPRAVRNPATFDPEFYRATVVHNLLFGGPLVISDGVFLTDLNFRLAVERSDTLICELIKEKYISIAVRARNGVPLPFRDIARDIRRKGGQLPHIAPDRDDAGVELDYLEKHASLIPYNLESASKYYRTEMVRVLESVEFSGMDLPQSVSEVILSEANAMISEGHTLGWSSFMADSELWPRLSKRLGEDLRPRYGQFIDSVARGPYVTFLPHVLDINSAFSSEDRLGVELWRGRHEMAREVLASKTFRSPRLSLANRVSGLAALRLDDIIKLRSSPALAAYDNACREFSEGNLVELTPLEALVDYRREVDYAILDALRQASGEMSGEQCSVTLMKRGKDEAQSWLSFGIKSSIKASLNAMTGGFLSPIEFGYQRIQKMLGHDAVTRAADKAHEDAAKLENAKELMVHQLDAQRTPIIDAHVVVDQPQIRDLFTSIESMV